jgi:hypothetical protein
MTEGDLVGLPIIEGECTKFNPPDWFHQACNEPEAERSRSSRGNSYLCCCKWW